MAYEIPWPKIMGCIPNPTIEQYMRLARVNQASRRAFLSDEAWAKFDVFGVLDCAPLDEEDYSFGSYQLGGIAGHFFNHLCDCHPDKQQWFLTSKFDLDSLDESFKGTFVSSVDLYSQINLLTLISKYPAWHARPNRNCFEQVQLDVWRLWATHPLESNDDPQYKRLPDMIGSIPDEVLQDKQLYLALINMIYVRDIAPQFRDDREVNLAMLQNSNAYAFTLSETLLRNKTFAVEALSVVAHCSVDASERITDLCGQLGDDRDLFIKAIPLYPRVLQFASRELQADREIVALAVGQHGSALQFASEELCADREIVSSALKTDGMALRFASAELCADREVVMLALKQQGKALQYADEKLCKNRQIVARAIKTNSEALRFATRSLRTDRELVLEVVRKNGSLLGTIVAESPGLCNDREIVLTAIESYGLALGDASEELRGDREIVVEAVQVQGAAIKFASTELRDDHQLALMALENSDCRETVLTYVSSTLCSAFDIVLAAVKRSGTALRYASEELRGNRRIVRTAMIQQPTAIKFASEALRNDPSLLLEHVATAAGILEFSDLAQDCEFMLEAVAKNPHVLKYAADSLWEDERFLIELLKQGRMSARYRGEGLWSIKEFVLARVAEDGAALEFADEELCEDEEIVITAMKSTPAALEFAAPELQQDPEFRAAAGIVVKEEMEDEVEIGDAGTDQDVPSSPMRAESSVVEQLASSPPTFDEWFAVPSSPVRCERPEVLESPSKRARGVEAVP